MRTLAHTIYLNMYIIYFFSRPLDLLLFFIVFCAFFLCFGVSWFFCFPLLIKIIWSLFCRLTSNNDSKVAHFQLKYIAFIQPFQWPFYVSLSIHFKWFPPFEIIYIKISIYFPFFIVLFCRMIYLLSVISSIYFMWEFRTERKIYANRMCHSDWFLVPLLLVSVFFVFI